MLGLGNGGVGKWLHGELLLAGVGGDGGSVLGGQGLRRVRGSLHCIISAREEGKVELGASLLGRTSVGGGTHGCGSSAGHGSRRGGRRGGLGVCRALVAPGRSGFAKQGTPRASLAWVRPSGGDRWPRRRTAPPWAWCGEAGREMDSRAF